MEQTALELSPLVCVAKCQGRPMTGSCREADFVTTKRERSCKKDNQKGWPFFFSFTIDCTHISSNLKNIKRYHNQCMCAHARWNWGVGLNCWPEAPQLQSGNTRLWTPALDASSNASVLSYETILSGFRHWRCSSVNWIIEWMKQQREVKLQFENASSPGVNS